MKPIKYVGIEVWQVSLILFIIVDFRIQAEKWIFYASLPISLLSLSVGQDLMASSWDSVANFLEFFKFAHAFLSKTQFCFQIKKKSPYLVWDLYILVRAKLSIICFFRLYLELLKLYHCIAGKGWFSVR